MKKIARIVSVALAVMMVLSLSAVSLAEPTGTVYIPDRIAKLNLPDRPAYIISLKTHTESAPMFDEFGNPVMSTTCKDRYTHAYVQNTGIVEDAVIELQFSKKPDWAGVIWAEGFENLEVDDNGYAVTSMEGHLRQPGTWSASGPCDPITGKPSWHVTGGDYAYMAGKGPVSVQYGRNGHINYVDYTVEEDFFQTGMEGCSTVIRYEPVTIMGDSDPKDAKITMWYISTVTATYPAGNSIVGVSAVYRNDEKNKLASYKISYAASETETYVITYAPSTATLVENHMDYKWPMDSNPPDDAIVKLPGNAPSENVVDASGKVLFSVHHYTADEPIYGEYYKNGELKAVTGSGNKINKWYKPGHGKEVKGLKPLSSFKSVRVK